MALNVVQNNIEFTRWVSAQQIIHESDELAGAVAFFDARSNAASLDFQGSV